MKVSARVESSIGSHRVSLDTDGAAKTIAIPPRSTGAGSSLNGGELLFLALATCYCNDIYRGSAKRGIAVSGVEVEVSGEFGAEGEPARNVTYRAKVRGRAGEGELRELVQETDKLAEIQNTLRVGTPVTLIGADVVSEKG